ncbi:phasin family protein [Paraburkholderia sp. GAS448]|uniref:TIGR01841 family phasin n=1 Tax=Paraburkholderia sp. GAS448 TaxID=3035136 RepID=UPI003D1F4CF3
MNGLVPEQLVAAQKAGVESTFGFLTKAFEGLEKLVELNLQVVKTTLAENQEIVAKAFSSGDLPGLFALQTSQAQPVAEKVRSYWQHVHEILSSTQGQCAAAAETQFKQFQNEAQGFVDSIAKNAPAGSETAVAAWKAFVTTASATYEGAKKATKQALEIAERNANVVAAGANGTTKQAVVARVKEAETKSST